MKTTDRISHFLSTLGASGVSIVKLLLMSRRATLKPDAKEGERLIVMGNGPSLRRNIEDDLGMLAAGPSMAVNFAANAPEFFSIRPKYYVLADPHFFEGEDDPNVGRLYDNFAKVEWPMTLLVPVERKGVGKRLENSRIKVETFNFLAVEGFERLENAAFSAGRGMPRPRNVLIPAIMCGIMLGYKEILVLGADHSWLKTLEVDEDNNVVTVQPHFYQDNREERSRVTSVYKGIPLHSVLESMQKAFRSYHAIRRYADRMGVRIINATPGSYIDAFERR